MEFVFRAAKCPKKMNALAWRLGEYPMIAALLITISFRAAVAGTIVDPWTDFLTMPSGIGAIHDLTAFTDPADGVNKLAIATGFEQGAPIFFWDPYTKLLTSAFTAPLGTYHGLPYWRSVLPFGGSLFAGLGNSENNPPAGATHTGQVWQYNGATWTLVLSTPLYDTYTLAVYNKQLYAGLGAFGLHSGQLWVTTNGKKWTMLKQFSSDYVRSLAVFQNTLYIGLRAKAGLWTYNGTTFTNIGPPPGLTAGQSQVKSLVVSPDGTLLYLGTVNPAQIWTWSGSAYALSLDASATDSEIYKGTVYDGDIFFPTHAKQNGGFSGNIYRFDNGVWTLDYSTPPDQSQLQVCYPFHGYIYAGGDGTTGVPPVLLQALYE
jgi:hypothetical protein